MSFKRKIMILAIAVVLLAAGVFGWYLVYGKNKTSASVSSADQAVRTLDLYSGDENIDWDTLSTTNVTLSDKSLTITEAGTYILTGTSTADVTVNTDGNVRLALNNATIKSTSGAAITVTNADNTIIQLVDGTKNVIEDASTRSDQTIDGAIYSADDLIFNGQGSLTVTSHFADAIVSNDDLKIVSGTYTIKSADDGIRGRDSVNIVDGTFTIDAAGDAIKSTNDTDAAKGYIYIQGGTMTITAGDDAIHAEEKTIIKGGNITISSSVEGIEGASVTIDGGTIKLYASDDGINAPGSNLTSPLIAINGGTIDVTVGQGDTDAIDVNGDISVTGGTIIITAPTSSFDYDGSAQMTGGNITINGEKVDSIPEPMQMGGGAGPR